MGQKVASLLSKREQMVMGATFGMSLWLYLVFLLLPSGLDPKKFQGFHVVLVSLISVPFFIAQGRFDLYLLFCFYSLLLVPSAFLLILRRFKLAVLGGGLGVLFSLSDFHNLAERHFLGSYALFLSYLVLFVGSLWACFFCGDSDSSSQSVCSQRPGRDC